MADRVNEVLNSDDKKGLDIINLLLLGWILLGLIVYILGNVIATQLKKRKLRNCDNSKPETSDKSRCDEIVENNVCVTESSEVRSESEKIVCNDISKISIVPFCEGDDHYAVQWINKLFSWLYSQKIVSPVLDPWLAALNTKTRLSSTEYGILVDFQSLLQTVEPPILKDCIESFNSHGTLSLSCFAEILDLKFKVLVTQVVENDKKNYNFLLHLKRLAGQLTFDCVPEDLSFVGKFSEIPQVELDLVASSPLPPEEELLHSLVSEITTDAISKCEVPFRFSSFPDCPKFTLPEDEISQTTASVQESEKEERLQVRVLCACNIGGSKGSSKPYCVVEMDDPTQKFETSIGSDGVNPCWEDPFIFVVRNINSELLFELYDKGRPENENFLGLCIVSVEELIKNPNQTQIMLLESRPMENDDVSGSLTAEFLFLGWDAPSESRGDSNGVIESGKTIEKNSRVTAGGAIITTTTIKRTTEGLDLPVHSDPSQSQNDVNISISESRQKFLKGLIEMDNSENYDDDYDLNLSNNISHSTPVPNNIENYISTSNEQNDTDPRLVLTISDKSESVKINENGIDELMEEGLEQTQPIDNKDAMSNHDIGNHLHDIPQITVNHDCDEDNEIMYCENTESLVSENSIKNSLEEKSHLSSSSSTVVADTNEEDDQELAHMALRELEKGKSGAASKSTLIIHSVQRLESPSAPESIEASPSSHPSVDSSSTGQLFSSPARERNGRRRYLAVPGSSRSSFSEASGISTESSRTYINENSTLVIEINENGIIKRYLIPTSMIHRSKWKKKGIKLHLYNDHVFIARHISSSVRCQVCHRHLPRRPGKQGYECRDCHLQCHKSCHVKVVDFCPSSSVPSMEVEYIHDPKSNSPQQI